MSEQRGADAIGAKNATGVQIGEGYQIANYYFQGAVGNAINEVSKADPENIQQVGAAQLSLSTSYYQNVLDQARRSFIAAIVSAGIGLGFFIAAVSIFLYRNDLRAGTVSIISGAIVELISGLNFWLYARTASQMNFFHIRLEQTQKYLLANSMATKLSTQNRETTLMELIGQIASSPVFNEKNLPSADLLGWQATWNGPLRRTPGTGQGQATGSTT